MRHAGGAVTRAADAGMPIPGGEGQGCAHCVTARSRERTGRASQRDEGGCTGCSNPHGLGAATQGPRFTRGPLLPTLLAQCRRRRPYPVSQCRWSRTCCRTRMAVPARQILRDSAGPVRHWAHPTRHPKSPKRTGRQTGPEAISSVRLD